MTSQDEIIHIYHNDKSFAIVMANIEIMLNLVASEATTNKKNCESSHTKCEVFA
jgi:hypothetical protein